MGLFDKKKGYSKVSKSSIVSNGSMNFVSGNSSSININGIRIESYGNKLKINGVEIDLADIEGSVQSQNLNAENLTPAKEFFEPGNHYLNSFSFQVNEAGKLVSINASNGADVVVNGNINNVTSSGSGDVDVNGNVGNLVKSGSGDVYKAN